MVAGADKEAVVVRAEAAVSALAAEYRSWAQADLVKLRGILADLRANPADADTLRRMYSVAHDMKGQAATFGYPLLTRIGHALCRFLEDEPSLGEHNLDHLSVLIEAVATVLERRLDGEGGNEGRTLLYRLGAKTD